MTVADDAQSPSRRAGPAPLIRVLQAMAGAEHGGAEMHFVRLCLALQRAGLVQHVLMRRHARRADELRAGGISPVEARFGGPLDVATRRIFRREIARFGPDIVLTYMSRATRMCPRSRPPLPPFVHVARLGGYYDLKYYRSCDHLVGITQDLADSFVAGGWPPERAHVIPNFVEDRAAPPRDRRRLDTPDKAPLVFALGRLHRNKAFDVLLAAVARLPGVHLWLAGEGPLEVSLKAEAAQLGIADRVRFLGWQDDPGPFFAAADMLVVPSRHEPLGSVLLEGWMHRKPVVAASSHGPRQLVTDGETGLLVPVDDAEALASAIRRVVETPALAAGLAARGRAAYEADYTEAAAVARYLALFDKVLG
jgi:glycosyltransferase involved in cell wall biosynthesis